MNNSSNCENNEEYDYNPMRNSQSSQKSQIVKNNNLTSSSQIPFENFILNKMEEKLDQIQKNRQLIMNVNSIEDFKLQKNKIIQSMFDMEDDIRESYQLVKSALIQNKDLIEHVEYEQNKSRAMEDKINTQEMKIKEVKQDFINLCKQMQGMKDKEEANERYIKDLETSLSRSNQMDYSNQMNQMEKPNNTYQANYRSQINHNQNFSSVPEKEFSSSKLNYKYEKETNPNINMNANMNTISTNNNYSDIITERENNKKLINDYVNDHLNNGTQKLQKLTLSQNNNTTDYSPSNLSNISTITKSTKQKANRVMEIVMKLNSNEDVNSIINKLFGENILNQLMSSQVEEELLERVEQTIVEIEKLREKDFQEENEIEKEYPVDRLNDQPYVQQNPPEREYLNKSYDRKLSASSNYDILAANDLTRSKNSSKNPNNISVQNMSSYTHTNTMSRSQFYQKSPVSNSIKSKNSPYEEYNFENSLRRYISGGRDGKVFKNYTKPYGDFFDPSLQKGGLTKIHPENVKKSRSKSKPKYNPTVATYISSPTKSYNQNNYSNSNLDKNLSTNNEYNYDPQYENFRNLSQYNFSD